MTHRRRRLAAAAVVAAVVVVVVLLLTSGSDRRAPLPEGGSAFGGGGAPAAKGTDPRGGDPVPENAQQAKQDAAAGRQLPVPLARAAAELFLVGFPGTQATAPFFTRLARRDWGGVVLTRADNYAGAGPLRALTAAIAATARRAGHRPPLVAAEQLGGDDVTVPAVGPFPEAQLTAPASARRQSQVAGRALRALGVRVVLGPALDLADAGGPWEGRAFSADPKVTTRLGSAAVAGWRAGGVAPVVGHFPGEGAASQDPGQGVATVGLGLGDLEAHDGLPFAAVTTTAGAVQMSGALYAAYDSVTPAALLPAAVARARQVGFGTVVSSDLTAATAATGESVAAAAVDALKAGCDLLYVPGSAGDQERAYRAVVAAVRSGAISAARVRDALGHIAALRRIAGV